jgi:hypothetical protein
MTKAPNEARSSVARVRSLAAGAAASLLTIGLGGSAHAVTLFMADSNPGGAKLNLVAAKDASSSTAEVLNPDDVVISVVGPSDFANGFANIKPAGQVALTDLIFTPLSATAFDSFSFRGQDVASDQTINVIVTDQGGLTQTISFTVDKANQDFARLGVIAAMPGETIKSVEIQNSGGFKEAKQFEFDLALVPEPSTWAMLITGFGLVGASLRWARRRPVAA